MEPRIETQPTLAAAPRASRSRPEPTPEVAELPKRVRVPRSLALRPDEWVEIVAACRRR